LHWLRADFRHVRAGVRFAKIECDPMRLRFIAATWKFTVEMWQCMVRGH
jgi:hypothetical protein